MKAIRKTMSQAEIIFHEQQALKRLKRIPLLSRTRFAPKRAWGRQLAGALLRLFAPSDLVRETAPGVAPQPRHEWERVDLHLWR